MRFPLSLRLVKEMLVQRGIVVSYETVGCCAKKLGPEYAGPRRRKPPSSSDVWHLDEGVVSIGGAPF
jgi:putative transposase